MKSQPVHISIDEIAFERGLYSHPAIDGIPSLTTENKLDECIENIFAPLWPAIIDRCENLQTRKNVARFIAHMDSRHPSRKKFLTRVASRFQKFAEQMPDGVIEIVAQNKSVWLRSSEVKKEFHAENIQGAFVNQMPEQAEHLSKILVNRRWGIVFSDVPVFVTSDFPVVLHRGTCAEAHFGFGTPGTMIFFPVSPKRMLVIDDSWQYDFAHYKLTNADAFNKVIAESATRFIYADKESHDLSQRIQVWRNGVMKD